MAFKGNGKRKEKSMMECNVHSKGKRWVKVFVNWFCWSMTSMTICNVAMHHQHHNETVHLNHLRRVRGRFTLDISCVPLNVLSLQMHTSLGCKSLSLFAFDCSVDDVKTARKFSTKVVTQFNFCTNRFIHVMTAQFPVSWSNVYKWWNAMLCELFTLDRVHEWAGVCICVCVLKWQREVLEFIK